MVYHLKAKKIFNELVENKSFEFQSLQEKINPNNLRYRYKTEGISPTDFRNYQNPTDLFINLRDGNINSREVIKDQINFKSDLGEIIKKRNKKIKIKRLHKCNTKCSKLFWFQRKNY